MALVLETHTQHWPPTDFAAFSILVYGARSFLTTLVRARPSRYLSRQTLASGICVEHRRNRCLSASLNVDRTVFSTSPTGVSTPLILASCFVSWYAHQQWQAKRRSDTQFRALGTSLRKGNPIAARGNEDRGGPTFAAMDSEPHRGSPFLKPPAAAGACRGSENPLG